MRLHQTQQAVAAARAATVAIIMSLWGAASLAPSMAHDLLHTAAASAAAVVLSLAAALMARSLFPQEDHNA